jgi:hypothetical protein
MLFVACSSETTLQLLNLFCASKSAYRVHDITISSLKNDPRKKQFSYQTVSYEMTELFGLGVDVGWVKVIFWIAYSNKNHN